MKMGRKLLLVIALLLTASMLITACGSQSSTVKEETTAATTTAAEGAKTENPPAPAGGDGPLGKYDPVITISTIRPIEPSRTYMPGETWDNNIWTKAIEEKLGVKFEYLWTCAANEYSSKVNVAIASDDLPEYMVIPYEQFYKLAAAGKLADLTEAYDKLGGGYAQGKPCSNGFHGAENGHLRWKAVWNRRSAIHF